jgi:hypothetical protein
VQPPQSPKWRQRGATRSGEARTMRSVSARANFRPAWVTRHSTSSPGRAPGTKTTYPSWRQTPSSPKARSLQSRRRICPVRSGAAGPERAPERLGGGEPGLAREGRRFIRGMLTAWGAGAHSRRGDRPRPRPCGSGRYRPSRQMAITPAAATAAQRNRTVTMASMEGSRGPAAACGPRPRGDPQQSACRDGRGGRLRRTRGPLQSLPGGTARSSGGPGRPNPPGQSGLNRETGTTPRYDVRGPVG